MSDYIVPAIFGVLLLSLIMWSASARYEPLTRTAMTLGANWLACNIYVEMTGNYAPWIWFWAIDLVSAMAVTLAPQTGFQKFIAGTYLAQIGWSCGFALSGAMEVDLYLDGLNWMLILQMLAVFTWGAFQHGLLHNHRFHLDRTNHSKEGPR